MNITYRIANLGDVEGLKLLNDEFNGQDSNTFEGIYSSIAREDAETVFVAVVDNKLVGFCCGQLLKSMCYDVFYVEITELYIKDAFHRQGIGKGLLNYAEAWYRQRDIHDFQLFTDHENLRAQKFYEHMEYRKNDDILYRKRDWWKKEL